MLIVDHAARTITGRAIPYGVVSSLNNGRRYRFELGSLRWSLPLQVRLLIRHDWSLAVGRAIQLDDRSDGLHARFQAAPGYRGDRALALASSIHCGLSIGWFDDAVFVDDGSIRLCESAELSEISLTPNPAFRQ